MSAGNYTENSRSKRAWWRAIMRERDKRTTWASAHFYTHCIVSTYVSLFIISLSLTGCQADFNSPQYWSLKIRTDLEILRYIILQTLLVPNTHDWFSIESGPPANVCIWLRFCFCDLDLDSVTLIYELHLDILRMYMHTINDVSRSMFQKLETEQNRTEQTDRRDRTHYYSHIRGWWW